MNHYHVLPAPSSRPPVTFATLEDALAAVAEFEVPEDLGAAAALGGSSREAKFDIVCAKAGEPPRPRGRPARHFFVDWKKGAPHGDGTEIFPWSGLPAAAEEIIALARKGEIVLRVGDWIRIAHREVFTATPRERTRMRQERIARCAFGLMVASLVIPAFVIIGYLFYRASPVLSASFILENPKSAMTAGGIWAPLVGTFYLAIISLFIDAPIGILAAIYLNEYARDNWLTRAINLAVVNLAGVPSIVHGLFGFGAFVLFAGMGKSVIAASCTLAVMSLPVIITSTREALASVPMAFREACWNVGATRWQTIRSVVLPNSLSGILTGVVFEICRTAGETAPILFTGAVFYTAVAETGLASFFPYGLGDTCMALQYHLFTLATQVVGVAEEVQFGTAAVLIGLTLTINTLSISLRIYFRSRKKW